MMRKWKSLFVTVGAALLLAGCTDSPPEVQVPGLTFEQYKPIMLNVAKIEVVDRFHAGNDAGNMKHVELLMKQPPEVAVQDLIHKQLVAAGPSKILRVIIDDASVTGEKLPVTEGVTGMFRNEPSERYHANVSLRFEMASEDAPDIILAHAEVAADRTKTVMKDASPSERDMAFFELDDAIMNDISHGFQTVVRHSFGLN